MRLERTLAVFVAVAMLAACAGSSGARPAKRGEANAAAAQLNLKLGQGYMEQGQFEIALEKLNRALELDPALADAHTVIAVVYEQIGKVDKAEVHYRRSVALKPEAGMMLNNFGAFLCRLGRFDEAGEQFNKALGDPFYRSPEVALGNAGSCARKAGRSELAERYYRRALEVKPKDPDLLLDMAGLMYDTGDPMRARAFMQRFQSLEQPSAEALELASRIERDLGDAAAAERLLDTLKRDFPDSPLARDSQDPSTP